MAHVPRIGHTREAPVGDALRPRLISVYLNDHLTGATTGVGLAARMAATQRGTPLGEVLRQVSLDITEDREALLEIMRALDVPVRRYKTSAGWVVERLGRLKPNGYLVGRSPLSTLVELETLRLGVEGKTLGWRTLRRWAEHDRRIDTDRLDRLIERAQRQAETVERLRVQRARDLFIGTAAG